MWKCSSRSIKSLFYKSPSPCNNATLKRTARNDSCINGLLKLSPSLFGHFNRCYGHGKRSTCGRYSREEQKRDGRAEKRDFMCDFHTNLNDALRLSGIFVVGWYLLQPFLHWKVICNPQNTSDKCTFNIISKYTQKEYVKVLNYLRSTIQPIAFALPDVKASGKKQKSKSSSSAQNEEEEFESKLKYLEKAHQKVTGMISNYLGASCMENGKYSEAFIHFQEGAETDNPASIFNLGLCYEMGLGTHKDFKKAADMYKRASDLGHPTATYNLGVFHVKGWGDVEPDIDAARKLFQLAADMGQPNARRALNLDNEESRSPSRSGILAPAQTKSPQRLREAEEKLSPKCNSPAKGDSEIIGAVSFLYSFLPIKGKGKEQTSLRAAGSSGDDSGALDLSPPTNAPVVFA